MSRDFGGIRRLRKRLSRYVRLPASVKRITNPIVGRVPVPILSGVNRGRLWSLASAGSGYGTGRRAMQQMNLVDAVIHSGEVVWDVGAHHGFVTLCAARRVGPAGQVHAFEPSARSRWFLERHVGWNRLKNVVVHSCAVGSSDGTSSFGGTSTSKQFRLGGGDEVVQVRRIGSLLAAGESPSPTFLKIDIEGAEADLLESCGDCFGRNVRMLIAIHSPSALERSLAALDRMNFTAIQSQQLQRYQREGWHGDADLFCIHAESPDAQTIRSLLERWEF